MIQQRTVAITGLGLLSALGVGTDAHWSTLAKAEIKPVLDRNTFAPYMIHPLPDVDWSLQIPKRSDQRQMEPWQRIGTFAAGLALADAGLAGDVETKAKMDMTIAAGGGERDVDVDTMILNTIDAGKNEPGLAVNETLSTELRPTLFLAQLSNLLAGNISIVHKVTGSSRTFMGEEGAGLSAISSAAARIGHGQSDIALVGASYNANHWDMLLGNEASVSLARNQWHPVFDRPDTSDGGNGLVLGSGGAFLVLEALDSAQARGARIYATITSIATDLGAADALSDNLASLGKQAGLSRASCILSAASGAPERTALERDFLAKQGLPFADITSATGYLREAQALMATAIAALSVSKSKPPLGMITKSDGPVAVITAGAHSAEGIIMIDGASQ